MYGCDLFGMHVCDSANFFLTLVGVSDVGNNDLIFICYFVVCSLCVYCIIGPVFCDDDMTILGGKVQHHRQNLTYHYISNNGINK